MQIVVTHISGLKQGERETITSLPTTIGRGSGCKPRLAVNDTRASTKHAELTLENGQLTLRDLNSTNGTYINGQRVERVRLLTNDIVEFGVDGPKLRFEFTQEEKPAKPRPSPAIIPASAPRPVVKPAIVQPAVAPPAPKLPSGDLTLSFEEREFAFKNRFKYLLFGAGTVLLAAGLLLFTLQKLLLSAPAILVGAFLILMGWACWRINITVNNQGIYYQGILRSISIRWEEIKELRMVRGRTRLLTHLVYVVRSDKNEIIFASEDYENGLEMATLISRRSKLQW